MAETGHSNESLGQLIMPTRNVNLTDVLEQFVATTVASGRYENASEVVRAGLRVLQIPEQGAGAIPHVFAR